LFFFGIIFYDGGSTVFLSIGNCNFLFQWNQDFRIIVPALIFIIHILNE